jgi:small subunit ribosomal protein S20
MMADDFPNLVNRDRPRRSNISPGDQVANTSSALKRMRQNERRRLRNRTVRSKVRTAVKTARTALGTAGSDVRAAVTDAIRALDKAVTKGVIHRNTAARKKSALARRLVSAK